MILEPAAIKLGYFCNISLEMDDSQISEVASGSNSIPRPMSGSSPSPHYAAPSPSASRPLSPGGKNVYFVFFSSIASILLSVKLPISFFECEF